MKPGPANRRCLSLVGNTLANDVWHRMREDILSGTLLPGQRLHFESLKANYDVSFGTLREALSRLTSERLVVATAQRGFVVASISVEEMLDVTRMRVLLESEATRLSIRHGDNSWRSAVLRTFHELESVTTSDKSASAAWTQCHRAFHASIISACQSPIMIDLSARLFDSATRFRRLSMGRRVYRRNKTDQHRAIMEAALTGDEETAAQLISRHIWETTNNVVAAMGGPEAVAAVDTGTEGAAVKLSKISDVASQSDTVAKRMSLRRRTRNTAMKTLWQR